MKDHGHSKTEEQLSHSKHRKNQMASTGGGLMEIGFTSMKMDMLSRLSGAEVYLNTTSFTTNARSDLNHQLIRSTSETRNIQT